MICMRDQRSSNFSLIGPPTAELAALERALIQAKKISFVETGENVEYTIWGARNNRLAMAKLTRHKMVQLGNIKNNYMEGSGSATI